MQCLKTQGQGYLVSAWRSRFTDSGPKVKPGRAKGLGSARPSFWNSLSTWPVGPYLSSDIPNVSLDYPQKEKLANCFTDLFLWEFVVSFQLRRYIPSKPLDDARWCYQKTKQEPYKRIQISDITTMKGLGLVPQSSSCQNKVPSLEVMSMTLYVF